MKNMLIKLAMQIIKESELALDRKLNENEINSILSALENDYNNNNL